MIPELTPGNSLLNSNWAFDSFVVIPINNIRNNLEIWKFGNLGMKHPAKGNLEINHPALRHPSFGRSGICLCVPFV
jgi:hypothetical protein